MLALLVACGTPSSVSTSSPRVLARVEAPSRPPVVQVQPVATGVEAQAEPARSLARVGRDTQDTVVVVPRGRGFFFDRELGPILAAVRDALTREVGSGRVTVGTETPPPANTVVAHVSTFCRPSVQLEPPCVLGVGFSRDDVAAPRPWPVGLLADVEAPGHAEQFVAATQRWRELSDEPGRRRSDVVSENEPPFRVLGTETQRHGWVHELSNDVSAQLAGTRACFPRDAKMSVPVLIAVRGDGSVEEFSVGANGDASDVTDQQRACVLRHLRQFRASLRETDRISFLLAIQPFAQRAR